MKWEEKRSRWYCKQKLRFHSERGAIYYAQVRPETFTKRVAAYECEYCGKWHLTSHLVAPPVRPEGSK